MITSLLLYALFGGTPRPAEERPILEAERMVWCGPGWETAIYPSGFAHQHVSDTCIHPGSYSRLIRVKPDRIETLEKTVEAVDLCGLPKEIHPETAVTDEDLLTITVRFGKKTCQVTASGLDRFKDRAVVERFLAVWKEVIALAPEPPE
jgi:hypothetical protein